MTSEECGGVPVCPEARPGFAIYRPCRSGPRRPIVHRITDRDGQVYEDTDLRRLILYVRARNELLLNCEAALEKLGRERSEAESKVA